MGHHTKTILSFVSMMGAAVGIVMLFGHGYRGSPPTWFAILSMGLTAGGALGIAAVVWTLVRRDRAPDFLREVIPHAFECSGICFLPTIETNDGIAWLTILFQNRYSRPCLPTIHLVAREAGWRLEPIEFAADGAEYGVFRRALNIPEKFRGRSIAFDIMGKNHFPEGRGRMLRFRDGLVVGQWSQTAMNAMTVAAMATGTIHIARPARVELAFPSEAQAVDSGEHPDTIESLWVPAPSGA